MLNVLHLVKILGVIESLVLNLPATLGKFEEQARGKLGNGKIGEPVGLNDRSVFFVLPVTHDPKYGSSWRAAPSGRI